MFASTRNFLTLLLCLLTGAYLPALEEKWTRDSRRYGTNAKTEDGGVVGPSA